MEQLLKNAIFTDWTSEGDNYIKKIKEKLNMQLKCFQQRNYYFLMVEFIEFLCVQQNFFQEQFFEENYNQMSLRKSKRQ